MEENEELRKGRIESPITPFTLPQVQDIQLTRSNVEKIKEQIGRELNLSVNTMMTSFSMKL